MTEAQVFDYMLELFFFSSTSLPGGNQVDGLPPAPVRDRLGASCSDAWCEALSYFSNLLRSTLLHFRIVVSPPGQIGRSDISGHVEDLFVRFEKEIRNQFWYAFLAL